MHHSVSSIFPMKMDADSSGVHRDSRGSRTRREREPHDKERGRYREKEREREREREREDRKVPYFADLGRERDRVRNLTHRSPRSTRRSRTRSRSHSAERKRRHGRRSRSRSRSPNRQSSRRNSPTPKIINYYVQVPAHEFNGYGYGMYGPYGMAAPPPPPRFGFQRLPRPSAYPSAPYLYHHRPMFPRAPRFSYRNLAWQPPH